MTLGLRPKGKGGARGVSEAQMAEALRKNAGNVLGAANALGISDSAIYQRLKNHPQLATIQAESRDRVTDLAKARVLKRIERDDWNAIKLWLTTQAGWATRTELSNPDGTPITPAVPAVHIHVSYVGDAKAEEDVI